MVGVVEHFLSCFFMIGIFHVEVFSKEDVNKRSGEKEYIHF